MFVDAGNVTITFYVIGIMTLGLPHLVKHYPNQIIRYYYFQTLIITEFVCVICILGAIKKMGGFKTYHFLTKITKFERIFVSKKG